MQFVTVEDVLDHARRFEDMLVEFYERLAERALHEGVRMLARHMARRQRRILRALSSFTPEQVIEIHRTPVRYEPEGADCNCFRGRELPDDATTGEVLEVALAFDECLARFYRQLLRQEVSEEVHDLFEGLLRLEEGDEVHIKKIQAAQ